jgi:hypothetical protein
MLIESSGARTRSLFDAISVFTPQYALAADRVVAPPRNTDLLNVAFPFDFFPYSTWVLNRY